MSRQTFTGVIACFLFACVWIPRAVAKGEIFRRTPEQSAGSMAKSQDYLDTSMTFQQRAADLVSQMTLEEKISQMQFDAPAIPRLGLPAYNWASEGLHGVARNRIATVFPQVIGMAATWDPRLIHEEASVISTEARAKYNYAISKGEHGIFEGLTFWAPNINIFRDPRWGRGQETYGEDPFLTSQMAIAFITGMQGNNPKYLKVIATPKHFDAYSGPELLRHQFSADVSKRDLFDTYLPAFRAAVREGKAYSVMAAYNSVNGVPCSADSFLLTDLLRKEWGFKGYVVSDCGAISDIYYGHKYAPSIMAASALAVKAGCDLTCGSEYSTLAEAVQKGLISEANIDTAVTRLMLARFKLGMFDPPSAVPYSKITIADNNTAAHRELARVVADESIVLLKDADNTLPLKKDVRSVVVVGAYADDINVLLGNYHGTPSNPVTILQGIKNKLGPNSRIHFARGYNLLDDEVPTNMPTNQETVGSQFLSPQDKHKEHGLCAEYFDNSGLRGKPALSRVDSTMDHRWGQELLGKGISPVSFSVRWNGTITPPSNGKYELGIMTSQKWRLYFGGKILVNDWKRSGYDLLKYGTVRMDKGKKYGIRIDYAHNGTDERIRFWWRKLEEEPSANALLKEAVAAVKKSDVVIAVAGISPLLENEENQRTNLPGFKGGDRTRLRLPAEEEKLLKALQETGKPVVLVLVGGSALAANWEARNIPAILDAWYPGEEGGDAVADVLFGDYNPAGRLPVTFYKSVKDLPPFTDYNMSPDSVGHGRTYKYFTGTPLYPFGFGLSYSKFAYSKLEVSKKKVEPEDTIKVSLNVRNIGKYDGDEVVQLYAKDLTLRKYQPIKSLVGFNRVNIKKGDSKTVTLMLPVRSFKYFSEKLNRYIVPPGKYEIQIGSSSSDIRLQTIVRVVD